MKVLNPFKSHKQMLVPVAAMQQRAYRSNDDDEVVSLDSLNGIAPIIDAAMQRAYNTTDFQFGDDEGGHFNREFNISANAGRMKALYSREPWVWSSILLMVKKMSTVNFRVMSEATGKEIKDHPLLDLLNKGNVHQDIISRRMSTYVDMIAGGNGLIALDTMYGNALQAPVENVSLVYRDCSSPAQERLVMEDGLVESIQMQRGFSHGTACGTASIVPYEQIVHFKFPNPSDPTWGISMLVAASRPILLDRHKNEFEMAFYLRGATNAGVIETTEDITKSRMKRLMSTFEAAFTGKRNWWRTLFLPKGAKWVNSGLTMNEMQHLEGLRENRRTLLATLHIPPSQVGIVEDVNRSTSETQETALWMNTIVPLTDLVAAGWNSSHLLRRVYGGQVRVEPVYDSIEAVQGSAQTRGERAKALDNIATVNEQRAVAGLPPLKENDPRGKMFLIEMQKQMLNPFASFSQPAAEDIGVSDVEDGMVPVLVDKEKGGDHTHEAMVDPETGEGHTVETVTTEDEEAEPHDHEIVGELLDDGTVVGHVQPGGADQHTHPDIVLEIEEEEVEVEEEMRATRAQRFAVMKGSVVSNQERIQRKHERTFWPWVDKNQDLAVKSAERALRDGRDVRVGIQSDMDVRLSTYSRGALPILGDAMADGFDMALATTRSMTQIRKKAKSNPRFNTEDELALQAIKQRTEDDRRKQLVGRNIRMFFAFDEVLTEQIMNYVQAGLEDGLTTEEVANQIAVRFGEKYKDQAFTIARTETLSAISAGIKWEQDALVEVFDKVSKQWLHVGDVGVNPNARAPHGGFETLGTNGDGVVPVDYEYINEETGAVLQYPRDPSGGAGDVINCRCSLVNVIPEDATSNASAILEGS